MRSRYVSLLLILLLAALAASAADEKTTVANVYGLSHDDAKAILPRIKDATTDQEKKTPSRLSKSYRN